MIIFFFLLVTLLFWDFLFLLQEQHGTLFQQAARRGKFSMFFSEVDSSASVSEGMNSLRARCPSSDVSSLSPGAIVAVRPEHCVVLASGWDKVTFVSI